MALLLYFGGHTHSHNGQTHLSDPADAGNTTNINVRAAMIHVIGDFLQSIGVLFAALLIFWNVSSRICNQLKSNKIKLIYFN